MQIPMDAEQYTLMSSPLSLLHRLGTGTESHEVALDDMLRILRVEPQRERAREMVRGDDLVAGPVGCLFHTDRLCQRRRAGERRELRGDV